MAIDKNAITKEAQKFAAKGLFDKAIAEWKKLVKESPNDANIFNTIGDLCLKKDSKSEAVDAYKKAGDILAADGFTSKAIALYKKVLNIDPQRMEVHITLADLNAEKGLIGNAVESYKAVASHYSKHNEMAKALAIYKKIADLSPSNITFRIKLADMYAKEGMRSDAAQAYLEAADVNVSKGAFQDAARSSKKCLPWTPATRSSISRPALFISKKASSTKRARLSSLPTRPILPTRNCSTSTWTPCPRPGAMQMPKRSIKSSCPGTLNGSISARSSTACT